MAEWEKWEVVEEGAPQVGQKSPAPWQEWDVVDEPSPRDVFVQTRTNPDEEAQLLDLSTKTGLDPGTVRTDRETALKLANLPDFEQFGTATRKLAVDTRKISYVHDDLFELNEAEKAARAHEAYKPSVARALSRSLRKIPDQAAQTAAGIVGAAAYVVNPQNAPMNALFPAKWIDAALTDGAAGRYLSEIEEEARSRQLITKFNLDEINREKAAEVARSLWGNPDLLANPEWMAENIGDAAASLGPIIAATALGGPAAGGFVGGAMEGSGLEADLIAAGVDADRAKLAGAGFGLVTGLLNKLGVESLLGESFTRGLRQRLVRIVAGSTTEALTEYAEEPVQALAEGIAKGEDIGEITTRVLDSFKNIDVLVGSLVVGGATATASEMRDQKAVERAEATQRYFDKLAAAAGATKSKGRVPGVLAEHIRQSAGEEGIENVYFQAERAVDEAVKVGLDPYAWAEEYGISRAELDTAVATGGTVKIDIGSAAVNMADDAVLSKLKGELLTHPEELAAATKDGEIADMREAEARIAELYQRGAAAADAQFQAEQDQIAVEVEQQLAGTGKFKGDEAKKSAAVFAQGLRVMAARSGLSPLQLFSAFNPQVERVTTTPKDLGPADFTEQEVAEIDADDLERNAKGASAVVSEGQRLNATVSANSVVGAWYLAKGYKTADVVAALRKFSNGGKLTARQGQIIDAWRENDAQLRNSATFNQTERDKIIAQKIARDRMVKAIQEALQNAQEKQLAEQPVAGGEDGEFEAQFEDPRLLAARDLFSAPGYGNEAVTLGVEARELIKGVAEGKATKPDALAAFHQTLKELGAEDPAAFNKVMDMADALRALGHDIDKKYSPRFVSQFFEAIADELNTIDPQETIDGTVLFQSAWHGSGKRGIDKFDKSFIGTGEGAQAFGYGHYFSTSKEIAEFYKEKLGAGAFTYNGESVGGETPLSVAVELLWSWQGDKEGAEDDASGYENAKEIKREIKRLDFGKIHRGGALYKVELAPAEDEYLRWDLPLSEQSENVTNGLKKIQVDKPRLADKLDFIGKSIGSLAKDKTLNGSGLYQVLAMEFGSPQAASEYLHFLGIRGIKYPAESLTASKQGAGEDFNFVIFDDADIEITEMFQQIPQGIKGTFNAITKKIQLTENADLTTFLHETGHLYLEMLRHVSGLPNAEPQLAKDWQIVKDWLGVKDGPITREQHEQFADGFLNYLQEGKAPAEELKGVFGTFRKWLTALKEAFAEITLSDEVKGVFDRMLATEEEIEAAAADDGIVPMLSDVNFDEMTPEDRDDYFRAFDMLKEEANRRVNREKFKADLKAFREQAEADSWQQKIYRAVYLLSRGTDPGQGGKSGAGIGIDVDDLASYGLTKDDLPQHPGLVKRGGAKVALAAIETGYDSADELLTALREMKPREQWVQERVAELTEQHDLQADPREAIRNTYERKMLEIESRFLAGKTGQKALTREQLKAWAVKQINGKTVDEAVKVHAYLAASRKLRAKVAALIRKGDFAGALKANEQARMNEALVREAYRARNDYQAALKRHKRYAKTETVDLAYKDQVNSLINRFQLIGRKPLSVPTDAPSLAEFMATTYAKTFGNTDFAGDREITVAGVELAPHVLAGSVDHKSLTWEEYMEVDAALTMLIDSGRDVLKGVLSDKVTTAEGVAEQCTAPMLKMKKKSKRSLDSTWGRWFGKFDAFLAEHNLFGMRMRVLDGYSHLDATGTAGPNERLLWYRIQAAWNREGEMKLEAKHRLEPILKKLDEFRRRHPAKLTGLPMPKLFVEHGLDWTYERVFCLALNMGNADNFQRIVGGYGLTLEQAAEVVAKTLTTREEVELLQEVWDAIDNYWDEIVRVSVATKNFRPKRVERVPTSFPLADGTVVMLKGGYYPISYDRRMSDVVDSFGEAKDLMESQEAIYRTPATKSGFTKGRASSTSLPLLLSYSVLTRHIDDVTHHIAFAETISDINRIFKTDAYKGTVTDVFGRDEMKHLRLSLAYMANPTKPNMGWLAEFFDNERMRASISALGFNVGVAAKQFASIPVAMNEVGIGRFTWAAMKLTHPLAVRRAFKSVFAKSVFMKQRIHNFDRDLADRATKAAGSKFYGKTQAMTDAAFLMIATADMVISLPTWLAAYEKASKTTMTESERVAMADDAVRLTQQSGTKIDMAFVQRQPGAYRFFTSFFSAAVLYGNRQRMHVGAIRQGKAGWSAVRAMMLEAVAPPLIMLSIAMLQSGDDDDDETPLWMKASAAVAAFQFQGFVIVRDLVGVAEQTATGKESFALRGVGKSPLMTGIVELSEALVASIKYAKDTDDDALMRKAAWEVAELVAYAVQVPATKVYERIMKGMKQYEETGDAWRLLLPDQSTKIVPLEELFEED